MSRMFEELFEQAPVPVYVYDAGDRFLFVNQRFEELFARPRSDFVGHHLTEVFSEEIATPLLANNAVVREHGRRQFQEVVPGSDGQESRTYLTEKFPLSGGRLAGVSVDVTDQVAAERQLRQRQAVLDAVANQAADMLCLHELPSGRVRWASAGARDLLGFDPDELVGTIPDKWLVLDEPAGLVEELGAAAAAGRSMLLRRQARTADGETRWVEVNIQPTDIDPETGEPRAAVTTIRDITERQRAYQELEVESRQHQAEIELMRHVLEAISDPVAIEDLETGEVVFTNSRMAEALTSDPDRRWREGDIADHARQELADDGQSTTVRSTFRQRDGRSFPVDILVQRLVHGERDLAVGVARDITELVRHQRELVRSERQFRELAERSDGLVYRIRFTPELEFDYVNARAEQITGYPAEALAADPQLLYRHVHEEDRAHLGFDPAGGGAVGSEEPEVATFRFQRADGRWIWLEDHRSPELDLQGRLVGHLGIAFDVTARREQEEARAAALEHERTAAAQLRRTMDAHEAFLRGISHELRTPLTSVIGLARTLRSHGETLDREQRHHLLDRVVGNSERLGDLLEELLDLDRLTRGALDLDLRDGVDLGRLCAAVVDDIDMSDHRLRLNVVPVDLALDRPKIERVVDNLVRNAVRHTPPGTTITVTLEPHDDEVELLVEDDGPGVPPEVVNSVFDPFRQGDEAAADASPGTGVGLAMVRAFVELHGGGVQYERRQPSGSRFRVVLPRRRTRPGPA